MPDIASASAPLVNPARDAAVISAIPRSAPAAPDTTALVNSIRSLAPGLEQSDGVRVYVTGTTALNIDVSSKLTSALPLYLVVVIGLALLLLLLVFRSVVIPVKAALGFLLTIGSTFGALVAVFQWGWLASLFGISQTGPIISFLPIVMIAILFGLSMDYEVFLVSGMRESHARGAGPAAAVVGGFRRGARVVTAAALIMTAVFSGFIFGDNADIKSVGFALAFGVLVDVLVVRMAIVPAVMSMLGRSAWWLPRWLARVLPNVDVEGPHEEPRVHRSRPDGKTVRHHRRQQRHGQGGGETHRGRGVGAEVGEADGDRLAGQQAQDPVAGGQVADLRYQVVVHAVVDELLQPPVGAEHAERRVPGAEKVPGGGAVPARKINLLAHNRPRHRRGQATGERVVRTGQAAFAS
jgi:predicted RND superfamily exporter protein